MSRVLISFLGTGPLNGHQRGEYREANYRFSETGHEYTSPFVADVICEEYNIDKVILVGTMHSIWDGVYDHFSKKAGVDVDVQVWEDIYTQCQNANNETPLGEIVHQAEIERVLGEGSKLIPIHYGLNAREIEKNSTIIFGLEQYLDRGDDLIIDITHSFRSLPMYIMNLLVYLQNVSEKRLRIKHICYGMLDVAYEVGYAPIIELKDILRVNEWISGAYSFKRFGNADKIAELVRVADRNLSERLDLFSKTKNLNHLAELERQSQELHLLLKNNNLPDMARMIISPVVSDFIERLRIDPNSKHRHSDFQYKLALWQRSNHNYLAAYISLTEAIITRLCEHCDWDDPYQKDARDNIKVNIRNGVNINTGWGELYRDVSWRRNALAHNTMTYGRISTTPDRMVADLPNLIRRYEELAGIRN